MSSHAAPTSWMGSEASFSSATGSSLASWPEPIGSLRDSAAGDLDTQPCAPDVPPPVGKGGLPRGDVTEWPVTFLADPADYARMWARHLVLTVLTLGLYWPWAWRHARRYFLQHTFVAGRRFDHEEAAAALAARHGLGVALAVGVLAAAQGSAVAGALAATVALLVLPMWLASRGQHALQALRWGRRPLALQAGPADVYAALWPWVAVGIALVWLSWWGGTAPANGSLARQGLPWACGVLAVALAPGALCAWWRCRQSGLRIGPLQMGWRGTPGDVYRLAGRLLVWALCAGAFAAACLSLVMAGWLAAAGQVPRAGQIGLVAVGVCLWLALAWPYAVASAQNLVWQHTGCRHLRFRSRLSVSGYVLRRARRLVTLLCTAGLAWPWVAIEARRMRLEALTVVSRVDPASLRAAWRNSARQAPSP